jgi:Nif-specific regulatory protein
VRRFSAPQARSVILIGRSAETTELRKVIHTLKDSWQPVLIEGERGVGKTLFAQILHVESARAQNDFAVVHCKGVEKNVLKKQLFGCADTLGLLSQCQHGTLCFKEISCLDLELQSELVAFINAPTSAQESKIQIRFIFTSSVNLMQAAQEGLIHPELYNFVSKFVVQIAPLRERPKDLADLLDFYLLKECKKQGFLPKVLSDELRQKLLDYSWKGNTGELCQAMSRLVAYNTKQHVIHELQEDILPIGQEAIVPLITTNIPFVNDVSLELKDRVLLVEREMILAHIKKCRGNKSKAAEELGISREALRKKLLASDEILQKLTGHVIHLEQDDQDKAA